MPDQSSLGFYYTIPELSPSAMVSDLIDHEHGCWDEVLIRKCFQPVEVNAILRIPLISPLQFDLLFWEGTSTRMFSVCSAYYIAMKLKFDPERPEASNSVEFQKFWRAIWCVELPRKCQNFLWRLCRNVLPTKDNLTKQKVLCSLECAICGGGQESMLHVFKNCVFAKKVWGACQWKVVGLDHDWRDPMDWVWGIWETKGVKGLLWFTLMGWSLWNARNSAVFKGSIKLPLVLCRDAHQYL